MKIIIIFLCVVLPTVSIALAINRYFNERTNEQNYSVEQELEEQRKMDKEEEKYEYQEVSTNDLINVVFEYLSKEGYRPYREKFSVFFKCEGTTFEVLFAENDHNHFGILGRFNYNKEDFNNIVYLINEFLPRYKLIKCFVSQKFIIIMTDTLVFGLHNVVPSFSRMLDILLSAIEEFRKELSLNSSHNLN